MRSVSVWARVLGVVGTVVEGVELEPGGAVVVRVRPRRGERRRCGICGRRCRGYDGGEGRRRWRALDLGATLAYLRGGGAPRQVQGPRSGCSPRPLGPPRRRLHQELRGAGGVAGDPLFQERGGGADAGGLENGGPDHHPRGRRAGAAEGPAGRADADWHR